MITTEKITIQLVRWLEGVSHTRLGGKLVLLFSASLLYEELDSGSWYIILFVCCYGNGISLHTRPVSEKYYD